MRKPAVCLCENKDADQLRGNHTADQGLCFCFIDSAISLFPKFIASSHLLWLNSLVCVLIWSETPKTGFLMTRLKMCYESIWFILHCTEKPGLAKWLDCLVLLQTNFSRKSLSCAMRISIFRYSNYTQSMLFNHKQELSHDSIARLNCALPITKIRAVA